MRIFLLILLLFFSGYLENNYYGSIVNQVFSFKEGGCIAENKERQKDTKPQNELKVVPKEEEEGDSNMQKGNSELQKEVNISEKEFRSHDFNMDEVRENRASEVVVTDL